MIRYRILKDWELTLANRDFKNKNRKLDAGLLCDATAKWEIASLNPGDSKSQPSVAGSFKEQNWPREAGLSLSAVM